MVGPEAPDGGEESDVGKGVPSRKEVPRGEAATLLTGTPSCPSQGSAGGAKGMYLLQRVVVPDLRSTGNERGVAGNALWSQTDPSSAPRLHLTTWRVVLILKRDRFCRVGLRGVSLMPARRRPQRVAPSRPVAA